MDKRWANLPQNTQVMSSSSLPARAPCSPAAPHGWSDVRKDSHICTLYSHSGTGKASPSLLQQIHWHFLFLLKMIIQVNNLRRTMTLVALAPQSWLPRTRAVPEECSQQAPWSFPDQSLSWTQNFNNWDEGAAGHSTQEIPSPKQNKKDTRVKPWQCSSLLVHRGD